MSTKAAIRAAGVTPTRAIADEAEAKALAGPGPTKARKPAAVKPTAAATKKAAADAGNTELVEALKTVKQTYAVVPIESVKPHPSNNNEGDIKAIRGSMQANDFYGACIVQKSSGYIVAGNHRWLVAKEDGLTELPVIFVDIDDRHALRILIADNATARRAKINAEATYRILKALGVLKAPENARGLGLTASDITAIQQAIELDYYADGAEGIARHEVTVVCATAHERETVLAQLVELGLEVKF